MNALLFHLAPEPKSQPDKQRCQHPQAARVLNADLFAPGHYNEVCTDCNGIVKHHAVQFDITKGFRP